MSAKIRLVVILGGLSLLAFSCSRNIPEPISPPINEAIPPTPTNFAATIGDRLAFLSWSVADTQDIGFYRLYQSDSDSLHFRAAVEVTETYHTVNNLHNGITYYFKVAAVNNSRFEGYASGIVSAVPNLYGIIINAGAQYTNNRIVSLSMVAPVGTRFMQVSNDSAFTENIWENFAATQTWELTTGDQTKSVYIKYRNQDDEITSTHFSDSIILDTQAAIDSITFSPSGHSFVTGDRIHFKVFAEEPDGLARIAVGQGLVNLNLYDDATRGDAVSGDGIYEYDFTVTSNLDFTDAPVFGNFNDRASNTAQEVQARGNMSVTQAPDPVSIFGIVAPPGFFDRLQIDWNSSQVSDFAQYRVYRAMAANVDSNSYLVKMVSGISATSLVDTGLTQNTIYYYKVYVVDNSGLWAGSNEVHASTNANVPPDPAVLFPAITPPGTFDKLSLSWSTSHDQDFLRYELYRSYDSTVTTSDILILASATQTTAVDSNLAADSTFYYRVLILDRAGNTSWSNTISGTTGLDLPPEPATIFPVEVAPDYYQSVRLQWLQPHISDFQSYRIYSWKTDSGRADSLLAAIISKQDSMALTFQPIFDGSTDTLNYWFIVHTVDSGGHNVASNALRVHLVDNAPGQVSGTVIAESTFISVSWNATEIPDFGSYRVMRDTLSSPAQSVPVFVSTTQSVTNFHDAGLVRGKTYYYWLDIYDRRGHSSRSSLGHRLW